MYDKAYFVAKQSMLLNLKMPYSEQIKKKKKKAQLEMTSTTFLVLFLTLNHKQTNDMKKHWTNESRFNFYPVLQPFKKLC